MKEIPLSISGALETNSQEISVYRKKRMRWIFILYVSFIGGISFGLGGLIISGSILLGLIERTGDVSLIGSLLAIIAFSLMFFGAHAMDRSAELDSNEKLRIFEAEHKRKLYSLEQWKTK